MIYCQDLCLLEETERGCLDSVGSRIIVTSHIDELVMFSAAPTIYHYYILLCALPTTYFSSPWFDVLKPLSSFSVTLFNITYIDTIRMTLSFTLISFQLSTLLLLHPHSPRLPWQHFFCRLKAGNNTPI